MGFPAGETRMVGEVQESIKNNEKNQLKPFLPMRIEENFILTTRGSPAPETEHFQ